MTKARGKPPPGDDGPLLDTGQLAAYLGIAEKTLRQWRSDGYGPPYFKLNRTVRYRQTDVDNWLNDLRGKGQP